MAIVERTVTTCDLCGDGAHPEDAPILTLTFAPVGGETHQVDLCPERAAALEAVLAPFASAGRKVAKRDVGAAIIARPRRGAVAAEARAKREYYALVREWAATQPDDGSLPRVSARGRIAAAVVAAFEKCRSQPVTTPDREPAQPMAVEPPGSPERVVTFSG